MPIGASALLGHEPCDPEAMREALRLHLARGAALGAAKGNGAPEIEHTYTRARRLSEQLGDVPALVTAAYRLWDFHLSQADLSRAHGFGRQLSAIARRESTYRLRAHNAEGWTALFAGAPAGARAHFERASRCTSDRRTGQTPRTPMTPGWRAPAARRSRAGCWAIHHRPGGISITARRSRPALAHPVGRRRCGGSRRHRRSNAATARSPGPAQRLCPVPEHGLSSGSAGGSHPAGLGLAERGDPRRRHQADQAAWPAGDRYPLPAYSSRCSRRHACEAIGSRKPVRPSARRWPGPAHGGRGTMRSSIASPAI